MAPFHFWVSLKMGFSSAPRNLMIDHFLYLKIWCFWGGFFFTMFSRLAHVVDVALSRARHGPAVSRRSPRPGRGGSFVQDLRRRTTFFDARGAARCRRCRWEATTTTNNNNNKKKAMAMTMTIIIFGCLIFLHMGCLITRGQLGSRTRICQNHQKSPQSWLPWFGASRGQCSQERSSTTEVCHHFTVCSRGAAIITHLRKL